MPPAANSLARLTALDPLAGAPQTERGARKLPLVLAWAAATALVAMSALHLWTGTAGAFTAMIQRSMHLAFALGLAFLLFPARWAEMLATLARFGVRVGFLLAPPWRKTRDVWIARINRTLERWIALRQRDPWRWLIVGFEALLLIAGVGCALYVTVFHEELARRLGANTPLDLVVAGVAVVLILEATRRAISPPLALIAGLFLMYAIFGHLLPGQWGHAPRSLEGILTQQYYTTHAIFGIPLAVSSTFVFLFVLFGAALDCSGAGRYLIDLAFATMGRFRGGPAKAAVVASGLMGTVSGSSIANTVTTGSLTIPLMKKVGFSRPISGAVEVAASTNGQLMPPVMGAAAFIMADMTGIAYATIIVAALLPALLSYTVIFTMIHLEALRNGIRASTADEMPAVWRTVRRGLHLNIPFIALLVLLLGLPTVLTEPMGFELARRTPSTAATYAIWITLALFLVVSMMAPTTAYGLHRLMAAREERTTREERDEARREQTTQSPQRDAVGFGARAAHFLAQSLAALRDGAMNMIGIACACAACGIIIGVVADTGLGFKITNLIQTISGGALLPALLLTALASILLGIGLPTTATYIIMATLTAPAILAIAEPDTAERSIALILATHLFVFYYGILADDTPPVGLCAYAAAGIAGADPIRTGLNSFRLDLAAFLLPLMFFYNHELLLQDVTWLEVMWVLPGAVLGMISFAMALQGWAMGRLRWWHRLILVGAAFLLVKPTLWATGVGIVIAAAAVASGWWLNGRMKAS